MLYSKHTGKLLLSFTQGFVKTKVGSLTLGQLIHHLTDQRNQKDADLYVKLIRN